MKLYYLHDNCTAYSSARNALVDLAKLSPDVVEKLADYEGYYDYVGMLPLDEMPNSKLVYLLDKAEQIFEEADPDEKAFWVINTTNGDC